MPCTTRPVRAYDFTSVVSCLTHLQHQWRTAYFQRQRRRWSSAQLRSPAQGPNDKQALMDLRVCETTSLAAPRKLSTGVQRILPIRCRLRCIRRRRTRPGEQWRLFHYPSLTLVPSASTRPSSFFLNETHAASQSNLWLSVNETTGALSLLSGSVSTGGNGRVFAITELALDSVNQRLYAMTHVKTVRRMPSTYNGVAHLNAVSPIVLGASSTSHRPPSGSPLIIGSGTPAWSSYNITPTTLSRRWGHTPPALPSVVEHTHRAALLYGGNFGATFAVSVERGTGFDRAGGRIQPGGISLRLWTTPRHIPVTLNAVQLRAFTPCGRPSPSRQPFASGLTEHWTRVHPTSHFIRPDREDNRLGVIGKRQGSAQADPVGHFLSGGAFTWSCMSTGAFLFGASCEVATLHYAVN